MLSIVVSFTYATSSKTLQLTWDPTNLSSFALSNPIRIQLSRCATDHSVMLGARPARNRPSPPWTPCPVLSTRSHTGSRLGLGSQEAAAAIRHIARAKCEHYGETLEERSRDEVGEEGWPRNRGLPGGRQGR